MKLLICEGNAKSSYPTRDDMIACWKENLSDVPELDQIDFTGSFDEKRKDEIASDYDAIIGVRMNANVFDRAFLERHPNLKYCATTAHGYEKLDADLIREFGLTLTNTIYGDITIAEYAMALLMTICHHVEAEEKYYRERLDRHQRIWSGNTMMVQTRQIELYGKREIPQILELYA